MATFHLSIISPQGEVFSAEIESLRAPGEQGYLGVMAHHAPMIAALRRGALSARTGTQITFFAVGPGVLEVADNKVLVLIDDAVQTDSLDEAAEKAQALVVRH